MSSDVKKKQNKFLHIHTCISLCIYIILKGNYNSRFCMDNFSPASN